MKDPNDEAMDAVIASMGAAAKHYKMKKWEPKPPPAAEAPSEPAAEDTGMPTADELSAILGVEG